MVMTWSSLLRSRVRDPHLRSGFRSGGRSLSGIEQRVVGDPYWELTISGIKVSNAGEALAYRALIAGLREGEPVIVPVCDTYVPAGVRGNGSGATLAANAALRATEISLDVSGMDLQAGNYLSLGGERLHLIREVVSAPAAPPYLNQVATDSPWDDRVPLADAVAAVATYVVKVTPPLRAAAPAGTAVALRDLRLRCVIRDAADGDLQLDLGRLGQPSLTLVEDV